MGHTKETRKRAYEKTLLRKKLWFSTNGPCKQCGSSEKLQVDHKIPLLKVSHTVWTWEIERMLAELAKCQVLCHECHKKKNHQDMRMRVVCGTSTKYQEGCRCKDCSKVQLDRVYRWRQNLKARGLKRTS